MRILICDDEPAFLEVLAAEVREYMQAHHLDCRITATADPQSAATQVFDIAFLDIQMAGLDGISLARKLRERNGKLALFFVTNYEEYQDEAMDLQAFRFFEKPFDPHRLRAGLDKAMEYIDGAYVDVFLPGNGAQQRVLVDDIFYITRSNRKVMLVTRQGTFYTGERFESWCDRLPQRFFYPVHKSFLVNLHEIDRYSYSEVILRSGTRIPVAPRKQAAFRKYWFAYLGNR